MKKSLKRKIGSVTLVVIISSIVFMLYATSTSSDIKHMKNKYNEYEKNIVEIFEKEYNQIVEQL